MLLSSGCCSVLVVPTVPTVKRPVAIPPELQFLVKEVAHPKQTERTVSAPGVYYGVIQSYFFLKWSVL